MSKKLTYALATFVLFVLSVYTFGQSINAVVGGSVSDPSKALIPGVTVTATNTGTGVAQTTVTNESGAYQFPALQPGTYKISAELPGFQTQTFTDVALGGAQQITLNFTLQVAAAAGQQVEVTVAADTVLATTSNSIGTVLPDYKLRDLPALTGNVLNVVENVPGVQRDGTGTFGYMAGGRLGDVNATLNGVNVNDGRYENGAWSSVYTPPDLVEEVKVIVAPVDAETSRGNGQVQMITRSGTNGFRGSLSWANHNSSLDANDWFNNQRGINKSFDNRNLYSARLGGPIIKNKTFFFLLFDGQRDMKKVQATGLTWTAMAQQGIFRYWPGVDSTNAGGNLPGVDAAGNPVTPAGATGPLSAIGLFGSCNFNGAPVPNCKPFNSPIPVSSVPYLKTEFGKMPLPNLFTVPTTPTSNNGDGLNTALSSFVRRQDGFDQTNGNSDEIDRDQYNARIDHNFNSRQRLSLIATNEHTWGTASQAGLSNWATSYTGLAVKRPVVYTIQLASTLSSSMLNQLRLGKSGTNNWQWGAADQNTPLGAQIRSLLYYANGIPLGWDAGGSPYATGIQSFASKGGFGRWREGVNPRYSIGDDLSWTLGKHAFKGGMEWRRTESNGFNDPNITPVGTLGAGNNPIVISQAAGFTGLTPAQSLSAPNFIYDMAGQIANVNEAFGILSATNTALQPTPIVPNNRHWNYQNEMSAYFKDDFKFRPDLTINLGLHWEYYGQPYEHNGLAARVVGNDLSAFFNPGCASTPGTPLPDLPNGVGDQSCSNLTQVQFVGKNSTHPNIGVNWKGNDLHSFAPALGFAWDLPWWGKGKTVLRGGYAIAYEGALRNFITVDGAINTVPGINLINGGSGITWNAPTGTAAQPVTTLANLQLPIPFPTGTPSSSPFTVQPTQRSLAITTYNYTNPYTQNWNLEIQREVAKNTTVEIRYVGTKGTKLWATTNYNDLALYQRGNALGLFAAFDAARNGGESQLLNQVFNGVGLSGTCVENGVSCTGAQILRTNKTTQGYLANGDYGNLLNTINTNLAYTGSGTTSAGQILRHAGFANNYLTPNPQYTQVNLMENNQNSTYHSLNLQVTRRLTAGFTNTTSFIWSKSMGAGSFVDPLDRDWKTLQSVDHKGQFSSSGSYVLPFGTGHALMGNAPGWAQRIVSDWQMGGIANYVTGAPLSFTSSIHPFSNNETGRPNLVGAAPSGSLQEVANGVTYFNGYKTIVDPAFAAVNPNCATAATCNGLANGLTNRALVDPNGNVIMSNPAPGTKGNLFQNTLRGPGALYFDMNMVKRIRVDENKNVELRVDIVNVLNHPNFADPTTSIESTSFGAIGSLRSGLNTGGNGGMRSFILNTRFNF